jgi:Tol biopolymer transport system component
LYVMEAVSGQVRMLSDQWVTAPPRWISSSRLAFIGGERGNVDHGTVLWWADLRGGPTHNVSGNSPGSLVTGDSWTADGSRVVYEEAALTTQIVIRDDAGNEITRSGDYNFPRVAFSASWSPDGKRLVLGGHNNQCPYGMLITDEALRVIVKSNATPSVCDPSWSPDGHYIAFNGVTQSDTASDGRSDVFVAEATGYGVRNLSGRLGGQIRLLGWIYGS